MVPVLLVYTGRCIWTHRDSVNKKTVDRCTPKTSKHHTMQIASNSDGAIAQETEFDVDIGPRSLIQLFALTAPRSFCYLFSYACLLAVCIL